MKKQGEKQTSNQDVLAPFGKNKGCRGGGLLCVIDVQPRCVQGGHGVQTVLLEALQLRRIAVSRRWVAPEVQDVGQLPRIVLALGDVQRGLKRHTGY